MGSIPEFTRTVLPDTAVGSAAISVSRAQNDINSANIGEARHQALDIQSMMTEYQTREAMAKNATWVNEAAVQSQKDAADLSMSMRQARLGKPEGFAKDFDKEIEKTHRKQLQAAPSEAARTALKGTLDGMRGQIYQKNISWGHERQVTLFAESTERTLDNLSTLALRAGQNGEPVDDLLKNSDATMFAGATFMDTAKAADMGKSARQKLLSNYIEGLAEKNPAEAIALLKSKKYDDDLGADHIQKLDNLAQAEQSSQDAAMSKALEQARSERASNYELMIESTDDPAELQKIWNDLDGETDTLGIIKSNNLRKKIVSQGKAGEEKRQEVAAGSAFISGEAYLNPGDSKAKKAYNSAYNEVVEPLLAQKSPEERNIIMSELLSQTKVVPDRVRGYIQSAARSNNPLEIKSAADFLDRVAITNPHLIPDLASERDISRVSMINKRIEAGVRPEDAIKAVDEQLDPKNAATTEQIKTELQKFYKEEKPDFQEISIDAVEGLTDFFVHTKGRDVTPSLDGMTANYRVLFEDAYAVSRDVDAAKKQADLGVKAMYGISDINGFNQVLQYPPERYYAISGDDNGWMRKQVMDAAKDMAKNSMEKMDLDNIRLAVDPRVTPRTAAQGAPRYKIYLLKDTGAVDLLGEGGYFFFDQAKRKKELIDEAR